DNLWPRLSKEEKDRMSRAEGRWPNYPRALVQLTDKDPFRLLTPATGPSKLEDLPEELRKQLPGPKNPKRPLFKESMGKWPDFAIAVTDYTRRFKIQLPHQFGPCLPR